MWHRRSKADPSSWPQNGRGACWPRSEGDILSEHDLKTCSHLKRCKTTQSACRRAVRCSPWCWYCLAIHLMWALLTFCTGGNNWMYKWWIWRGPQPLFSISAVISWTHKWAGSWWWRLVAYILVGRWWCLYCILVQASFDTGFLGQCLLSQELLWPTDIFKLNKHAQWMLSSRIQETSSNSEAKRWACFYIWPARGCVVSVKRNRRCLW